MEVQMNPPSAPRPPDPVITAQAQSASNSATAQTTQALNMVDQITPDGTLRYTEAGKQIVPDGFGGTMFVPKYAATQTLSEPNQRLYDIGKQTETNIATIGRDQSARIGGLLGTPIKLGNEATEARLMELGSARLNPRFAREEETLRTRLANSGIRQGSAAWDAEMERFGQNRNDAFNQLLLTGRGTANQEILTERNQPINEISALLSQSQVSQPDFRQTPSTQVAGVDYAGLVNNNYRGELDTYRQKVGMHNAMMGGLFGLAGDATKLAFRIPGMPGA
jgi:hypothetical protein